MVAQTTYYVTDYLSHNSHSTLNVLAFLGSENIPGCSLELKTQNEYGSINHSCLSFISCAFVG